MLSDSVDVSKIESQLNKMNIDDSEQQESEQSKLFYRLNILCKEIEEKSDKLKDKSFDTLSGLKFMFKMVYRDLGFSDFIDGEPTVQIASKISPGDYQCNDAMRIYQKTKNNFKSPKEVAEKIIENLPKNTIVESASISGPGFINLVLKPEFYSKYLYDILKSRSVFPPGGFNKDDNRVLIDFSSPNIAKEMHVGHLRSTIIGECLCRLFEYLGCTVMRINHLGDWGTQFGMLIQYLEIEFGDLQTAVAKSSISDLQAFYKNAKQKFDSDPEFKSKSLLMVVRLQSGDQEVINAWKMICDISRIEFSQIYNRLGVTLEDYGESFYQPYMKDIVIELNEKKLITVENDCQLVFVENEKIPPLHIVKSDGGFTYDTSDMATLKYRLYNQNANIILYVVDNGQADHFKGIFLTGRKLGWYQPYDKRVEHIGFGVVLGEDKKKFKTRSGTTIKLSLLLDEGVTRAKQKILKKLVPNDENNLEKQSTDGESCKKMSSEEIGKTAEALAYSCIKYSDLAHHRTLDYVFSFDKMLDDRGNTAVYLLYASTRIKSILRNCEISIDQIIKNLESREETENIIPIKIDHDSEIALAKKVTMFPIVLRRMATELLPHFLCEYLYELAVLFNDFYEKCYCIEKDKITGKIIKIYYDRLALLYSTLMTLETGFKILGIDTTIERM